jgi:nucleotide-binding universal stress UspA family protein
MNVSPGAILCATDFSPIGNAAVAVAYGLARPGTVVHLFHVAEPAVVMSPLDGTILTYRSTPEDLAAADRRAHAKMRALAPDPSTAQDVRTEVDVVHEMGVGAEILAKAKRVGAGVIVLGTHGRSGIGRILMGSVAADVMKGSQVPVVLVNDRRAR